LEVGKAADLALFSINDIGLAGALHDPVAAPFMSFSTGRTDYTIVQGEVVVEQGTLVGADVEEIIFDANKVADQMLQVASMRTGIDYHQD
jgi:cytosine/adenosine deaminase-related metal-dependent hydrolase